MGDSKKIKVIGSLCVYLDTFDNFLFTFILFYLH